jgi:hypothetical protein
MVLHKIHVDNFVPSKFFEVIDSMKVLARSTNRLVSGGM